MYIIKRKFLSFVKLILLNFKSLAVLHNSANNFSSDYVAEGNEDVTKKWNDNKPGDVKDPDTQECPLCPHPLAQFSFLSLAPFSPTLLLRLFSLPPFTRSVIALVSLHLAGSFHEISALPFFFPFLRTHYVRQIKHFSSILPIPGVRPRHDFIETTLSS